MTTRIPCPRCGSVQAVNLKTNPLLMWPHRWCTNVLAPPNIKQEGGAGDATSAQVVERARITYRQLDWWLRQGYLRARHGGNTPGSGHQRAFTEHEARVAEAMAALVALGVTPAQAARIGRRLATKGEASVGDLRITREAS